MGIVSKHRNEAIEAFMNENKEGAISSMRKYVDEASKIKVVLKDEITNSFRFLDYNTRFSAKYRKKTRNKVEQALRKMQNVPCGHLVLTIENLSFAELNEKKRNISRALYKFFDNMQGKLKKKIKRVITCEVKETKDKKFHLHFHCLLFYFKYISQGLLKSMKETWQHVCANEGLRAFYLFYKYVKQCRNTVYYVMKYITKDFRGVNLTSTLLSVLKLRSYRMVMYNDKDEKDKDEFYSEDNDERRWTYVGIISECDISFFKKIFRVKDSIFNQLFS